MDSEIFLLFDEKILKIYLQEEKKKKVVGQFARFVAAYYLNLKTLDLNTCIIDDGQLISLPNLLIWASNDNALIIDKNNLTHSSNVIDLNDLYSREKFANSMPAELTPNYIVRLLWHCLLQLEAIFFADNFNDFRSQIILRKIFDIQYGHKLFNEHCKQCLIESLINDISTETAPGMSSKEIISKICCYVDCALQIDIIYETNILEKLKLKTMECIEKKLTKLEDDVDLLVRLPRPPIYATPSEYASDLQEINAWNCIHYLMQILFHSLNRTNCLASLISMTSQRIVNAQNCKFGKYENEVYLYIENDYLKFDIPDLDVELFNKILLCILQMTLRDEISQFWRRQNNNLEVLNDERNAKIQNEFEILEKKFAALFLPLTQFDDWNTNDTHEKNFNEALLNNKMSATFVLQRWIDFAMNEWDVDQLMTFFRYLNSTFPQTEKFLPLLNKTTQNQWSSLYLSQIKLSKQYLNNDNCIDNNFNVFSSKLYNIELNELVRLKFLAYNFPTIMLNNNDQLFINISLCINPLHFVCYEINNDDYFESESQCTNTFIDNNNRFAKNLIQSQNETTNYGKNYNLNKTNKNLNQKINNKNEALIENIRSSIRRLCKMQEINFNETETDSNDYNKRDKQFNELITDYQLTQTEADIQQRKLILANIKLNNNNDDNQKILKQHLNSKFNEKLIGKNKETQIYYNSNNEDFDSSISQKLNFLKEKLNKIEFNTTIPNYFETNEQSQLELYNEIYQQNTISTTSDNRKDNDSAISEITDTERSFSSKKSDKRITPISSERFKFEIDDIGARLSKIRQSLHTDKKNLIENIENTESILSNSFIVKSNSESNKNSSSKSNIEKVSIVSADSACYYSSGSETNDIQKYKKNLLNTKNISPISGIERLDLSQLNTFKENKKSLNNNWTEIEIYPRPNQQQQQQQIQENKLKKTLNNFKNSNFNQKLERQTLVKKTFDFSKPKNYLCNKNNENKFANATDKYPKWLTLVPNTAINEILTKNSNKKINNKNLKYKSKTINNQNILQLTNEAFTKSQLNLNQLNNINQKQKNSTNLLFACDMSQSQIDYLLNKNISEE